MPTTKTKKVVIGTIRILLGLVFIFSGFVKGVDPWGTAIKLGEYFQAFGMEWLSGMRYVLSVCLSGFEMLLGFGLLFRLGERLTAWAVTVMMFGFTILTLIIAIGDPVADCGCFGDAVKLTNWETFYKNIVLLAMAVTVLYAQYHVKIHRTREQIIVEWSMTLLFTLFSLGVGLYSLRHLPIIDFLPFKIGTNLGTNDNNPKEKSDISTILTYKDKKTGELHDFTLEDTTWYDTLRWEFVDTRVTDSGKAQKLAQASFALFDENGDQTGSLLYTGPSHELFIITLTTLDGIKDKCSEKLLSAIEYARKHDIRVVCATTSSIPPSKNVDIAGENIPVYNIDGVTLKSLIRTDAGLVAVKEGTILEKWNCRDIPDLTAEEYAERPLLAAITLRAEATHLKWLLGVMAVSLILIYIAYFTHRGYR